MKINYTREFWINKIFFIHR